MPKITRHGGASSAEREHPGTGVPMEGVEVPADGTMSPEIVGDGSGEAMPPIEEEKPKPKRARRSGPKAKAADATATLTVTAEAQVTRPDGSVS